jgi:hypothetical protein
VWIKCTKLLRHVGCILARAAAAAAAAGRRLQGQYKTLAKPARFSPIKTQILTSKTGVNAIIRYFVSQGMGETSRYMVPNLY